jgi:hypothetical protein
MSFNRIVLSTMLLVAAGAVTGRAQEAPEDALSAIRTQEAMTDENRAQIRSFISQRIQDVIANQPVVAGPAMVSLRQAYTGSGAFRSAYAEIATELIGNAARRADLVPATRLLAVLTTLDSLAARDTFVNLLRDDRVGVRAAAAIGLRGLRQEIAAAGGNAYQETLDALRQAGEREKSRDTLRNIYSAMDYATLDTPPGLQPAAAALLGLLQARAQLYRGDADVPAIGADDAGLRTAITLVGAMNEAQRRQLILAAASMTKVALEQYTNRKLYETPEETGRDVQLEQRNAMERLILMGERALAELLKPDERPEVLDTLGELDIAGAKLAWKEWNALLRQAVDQDFGLAEAPAEAGGGPEPK